MYYFRLIVLLLLIGSSIANIVEFNSEPLADSACASANCEQGTCKPSNTLPLGYECECYPGWKQMQIGPLTLPPCIVPNCTLNSECGAPSPLPPPPSFNLSNPCSLTWCGDGTCVTNGTGYTCKCNANSDNLMNVTGLPCYKKCSFSGDCPPISVAPPSPSPNASPPPNLSASNDNDSACASANCGQGTCKPSNSLAALLLGYECECYPGWKHLQIGSITLPPCLLPNCTLISECDAPSLLPPPPTFNLSNPCSFTWCGDGTCVTNGTGYTCNCNANSDNLLNLTGLPCFKECSISGECLPNSVAPPSPSSNASPPPNPSGSNDNGSIEVLYYSGIRFALTLLPVSALLWF